MSERERFFVLVVGSIIAVGVTAAIVFLAISATDVGERSILIGGLIGTGAFGGGALFSLLGVGGQKGAGTTVTVPQPPDPPITVSTGTDGDLRTPRATDG